MTNKQGSTAEARTNKNSSAGPKTPAGKRRARLNALKHGFFSRELVVQEVDKAEFETLREAIRAQLSPQQPCEAWHATESSRRPSASNWRCAWRWNA